MVTPYLSEHQNGTELSAKRWDGIRRDYGSAEVERLRPSRGRPPVDECTLLA